MTEADRHKRNAQRLRELHPDFAARVRRLIAELESEGWRPRIEDAWRSAQRQRDLWAAGRSARRSSLHTATSTAGRPEALAADLVDDDSPCAPPPPFLLRLAAAAGAAGLATGIRWGLPRRLARAIDEAIELRAWHAPVKLGWDPAHVHAAGLTPAGARTGSRPAVTAPARRGSR